MNYTLHGMERSKERLNRNMKAAARQMELAMVRGCKADECSSSIERNFLSDRCNELCYAIAYNGCCYIVNRETEAVVTVYSLPSWWGKKKRYEGKERVKKAKAYYRMNDMRCYA